MKNNSDNIICDTDSYKESQPDQYEEGTEAYFGYVSARLAPRSVDPISETVFFGLQIFLNEVLSNPFTKEDIDEAEEYFLEHMQGVSFPRAGFEHILKTYNGYMPVVIKAVPEGMVIPEGNVLATIECHDHTCFWIAGWLETMFLRDVWYMSTVATNSRECKKVIMKYLELSSDNPLLEIMFKLHDFGSRGVSAKQAAEHGGAAHLVNFYGSDTCVGVRCANRNYFIKMAGFSIAASEHSTITTWGKDREVDAYANMLRRFGKKGKVFACVSDSYDIFNACENIWGGSLKQAVIDSGATLVIRPDSGNPAETILKCLKILDEKFGSIINKKGYKVLNYVRIIQGDGINIDSIKEICRKVVQSGFSMDNVNFGMGGALLQHLNRDTLRFAMKCSATKVNGEWRDASKSPIGDPYKKSMAGRISLYKIRNGHGTDTKLVTLRKEVAEAMVPSVEEILIPVYENGKLLNQSTFDEVRKRASLQ
jgi:nicotinamide phosphoribosyltransferase